MSVTLCNVISAQHALGTPAPSTCQRFQECGTCTRNGKSDGCSWCGYSKGCLSVREKRTSGCSPRKSSCPLERSLVMSYMLGFAAVAGFVCIFSICYRPVGCYNGVAECCGLEQMARPAQVAPEESLRSQRRERLEAEAEANKEAKKRKRRACRLPPKIVRPTSSSDLENGGQLCTICLEELIPGTEVPQIPCDHDFHPTCLVTWCGESYSPECPTCREHIFINDSEPVAIVRSVVVIPGMVEERPRLMTNTSVTERQTSCHAEPPLG